MSLLEAFGRPTSTKFKTLSLNFNYLVKRNWTTDYPITTFSTVKCSTNWAITGQETVYIQLKLLSGWSVQMCMLILRLWLTGNVPRVLPSFSLCLFSCVRFIFLYLSLRVRSLKKVEVFESLRLWIVAVGLCWSS